jgi:hypothetical protein
VTVIECGDLEPVIADSFLTVPQRAEGSSGIKLVSSAEAGL